MKSVTRALIGTLMAASLGSAAVAQTAKPCLQPAEAEDLVSFIMPALMDGMARKCRPMLPGSSVLGGRGAALAERYRPTADAAWPGAKAAFLKLSGDKTIGALGDQLLRGIIAEASSAAIVGEFKAKDCAMADRFVSVLEPLPAQNMSTLVVLLMEIGAADAKESPMKLCKAAG